MGTDKIVSGCPQYQRLIPHQNLAVEVSDDTKTAFVARHAETISG
jgi:hypothetical protein